MQLVFLFYSIEIQETYYPNNLQFESTKSIPIKDCEQKIERFKRFIHGNRTICTDSLSGHLEQITKGNYGRPLVIDDKNGNWQLVGILSLSTISVNNKNLYTNVCDYKFWMETIIEQH